MTSNDDWLLNALESLDRTQRASTQRGVPLEHVWPADLEAHPRCEICGLDYHEWDADDPGCHY